MSDSGSEDCGSEDCGPGRGKVVQRQKRELKELREQQKREANKLTSFAKAKREHQKVKVRAEKREHEEKFRQLEEAMRHRHSQELEAFAGACTVAAPEDEPVVLSFEEEGSRRERLQRRRERLAEIEKEVREASDPARIAEEGGEEEVRQHLTALGNEAPSLVKIFDEKPQFRETTASVETSAVATAENAVNSQTQPTNSPPVASPQAAGGESRRRRWGS